LGFHFLPGDRRGAAPWYEVVRGGVNVTDPATGINTWRADGNGNHSYLVLKTSKAEIETALEDMMVTGRGRPTNLKFNTAYYAEAGMCQITAQGEAGDHAAPARRSTETKGRPGSTRPRRAGSSAGTPMAGSTS
jgi:hypothetical protein